MLGEAKFKTAAGLCFLAVFALLLGCGSAEEAQTQQEEPEPVAESVTKTEPEPAPPPPPPPVEEPAAEPPQAESSAQAAPEMGQQEANFLQDTVWAPGREGDLIQGLDNGFYEPYSPTVVQSVQQDLKSRGLYAGGVHGVLDESTMQAIAKFQEENKLQVCGVPTPNTREALQTESSAEGQAS